MLALSLWIEVNVGRVDHCALGVLQVQRVGVYRRDQYRRLRRVLSEVKGKPGLREEKENVINGVQFCS